MTDTPTTPSDDDKIRDEIRIAREKQSNDTGIKESVESVDEAIQSDIKQSSEINDEAHDDLDNPIKDDVPESDDSPSASMELAHQIEKMVLLTGKLESISDAFEKRTAAMSPTEFNDLITNNDPEIERISKLRELTNRLSAQQNLLSEYLNEQNTEDNPLSKQLQYDGFDKTAKGTRAKGHITGPAATTAIVATLRGMKMVYLYNSGFWVMVRPLTIAQLNAFFTSIDLETAELGRDIGQAFYSFADVFIKRKFCELISANGIVKSNLIDYTKEEVLFRAVDLQDYDTLVWAMCCLLYRESEVQLPIYCLSDKCFFKRHESGFDLNKMRFDMADRLTPEQLAFTRRSDPVTLAQVHEYRRNLPNSACSIDCDHVRYTLKTPSIYEYLQQCDVLVSKVVAYTAGAKSLHDQAVFDAMLIHLNQAFSVWISRISTLDDDDNVIMYTEEQEAILASLEPDLHIESKLFERIGQFILDSKISFYCYTNVRCPQCGAEPSAGAIDEFIPLDVQALFFDLTYRKLRGLTAS